MMCNDIADPGILNFTYKGYFKLLDLLKNKGYFLTRFCETREIAGPRVILRHDIDISPREALKMAKLEHARDEHATYFVMLSSSFYNLLNRENEDSILHIAALGHEVGLHFDVTKYRDISDTELEQAILREISLLSHIMGTQIKSLSWHIPREDMIGRHLDFLERENILNAYDPEFFTEYKYCSDSMMRWRDPLTQYIDCTIYPKLQVLTHPIWYSDTEKQQNVAILKSVFREKNAEIITYLERCCPGIQNSLA